MITIDTHFLTLIFVIFKLAHMIYWSWWFVCLPSLIPLGMWGIAGIIIFATFLWFDVLKGGKY